MKKRGLLRWRDVTADLQQMVAAGAFGPNLRLYQLPDGTWQLIESIPEQELLGAHRLDGRMLFLSPFSTVDEMPVEVNGELCNAEPPPFIELTDAELLGPTTAYITTYRSDPLEPWVQPAKLQVEQGVKSGGGPLEYFRPAALILGGSLITVG